MNKTKNKDLKINFSYLPKNLIEILKIAAKEVGIKRIAIVGGAIRDQLAQHSASPTVLSPKDLDILIEGSAYALATKTEEKLGSDRVSILRVNDQYRTIEMRIDDFPIDIATAREEIYVSAAENPQISITTIEEDLKRRDFTINSIALSLFDSTLLDPFNGQDAILERRLEFIHSKSVEEDPTRIIRGARYAAKLNLNISTESNQQIKSTLEAWPWSWKPGDIGVHIPPALGTRLRMELEILFQQTSWEKAIEYLQDWGALKLLDLKLQEDLEWKERLSWAIKLGLEPLTAFIAICSDSVNLAKRLQLPQQQQQLLASSLELEKFFSSIYQTQTHLNWRPSNWCEAIESHKWKHGAISIAICLQHPLWKPLLRWLEEWQKIKSPISAKALIEQGWSPGPSLKKELKRLRYKKLDTFY